MIQEIIIYPNELKLLPDVLKSRLQEILVDKKGFRQLVDKITSTQNIISRTNGSCTFFVEYTTQNTIEIPTMHSTLQAPIDYISSDGIFLNFNGIQIIIPLATLPNFRYIKRTLEHMENNDTLRIGQMIEIYITYKQQHNCIAKFIRHIP